MTLEPFGSDPVLVPTLPETLGDGCVTFHCESCLSRAYNPAEVAAAVNDPKFEIQERS